MPINCLLVVAGLIVGFLLGRVGSKSTYDGVISFGKDAESFKLDFAFAPEQLARHRALLLYVDELKEERRS